MSFASNFVRGLGCLFTGARVGVGLVLDHKENGDIIVTAVEAGSPAHAAGVCVDDVLAKVDGMPQQWQLGHSDDALQDVLMGPPGSHMSLSLRRWNTPEACDGGVGCIGEWDAFDVFLQRPKLAENIALLGRPSAPSVGLQPAPAHIDAVQTLQQMGYGPNTSVRALLATANQVNEAIDWIALQESFGQDLERALPEDASGLSTAEAAAIEVNGGRLITDDSLNAVEQLMALGFERPQVEKALRSTQGRVMMAADMLFEKQAKKRLVRLRQRQGGGGIWSFFGFGDEVVG